MKKSIRTINFMVVLALMISFTEVRAKEYCYDPYGSPVTPEFVVEWSFIKFNWVEGERGMEAYASYAYDEETNSTVCLITARMPDEVIGDPEMDSLGHEVLHCVTGDFHPGDH